MSRGSARIRTALVGAIAVAVLAAGCSSGGGTATGAGAEGTSTTTRAASTTSSPPAATEPFTGTDFYGVPDPLPSGPHGTLIRFQPMDDYDLGGSTAYRIMYLSKSLEGQPIAVTGVALVPDAEPPAGGRPMITISHGTTGIADECAPSKHPQRSEITLVGKALAPTFLIAATDYEGLGTPGRHPYLVGPSEGRSSIDALLAAGQLPDAHPGKRFAIAGYSQGGHGALWTSQVAAQWAPDLTVVGTFAGAPASEIDLTLLAAPNLPQAGFAYMLIAGYGAAYPQAEPDTILTPEGVKLLDAVDHGCAQDTFKALAGKSPKDLIEPGAAQREPWKTLTKENDGATEKTNDAPTLIIHSKGDRTVPLIFSQLLLKRMCANGQVVERRLIDEGGHTQAAIPAYEQAMTWIEARFEAHPPKPVDSCSATP